MEIKDWTYEEFPEFTEEVEGVKRIFTSGDEPGSYGLPGTVYANVGGKELHLQILMPITRNSREKKVKYPCVVFVQGSGWKEQNIFEHIGGLGKLAERGYVVAITEYRHSGIAKFPAQAEDARNAIRFMKKNAEIYGVDADNVFAAGDSSGGHTAMFAGILKDDDENTNLYPGITAQVRGIISLYGSLSIMLEDSTPSNLDHLLPDSPEGLVMGGADLRENPELRKKLSLESYLHEDTKIAPVLMFHGTKDRVINARVSVMIYQRLKELGREAELYLIEGGDHSGAEYWTEEVIDIMDNFLKRNTDKKQEE